MPLNLRLASDETLPIDVRGLSTAINEGLSASQIASLPIYVGKRSVPIGDCFDITGDGAADRQVCLSGDLANVHSIGRGLAVGNIVVESSVGRHLGTAMSGGHIKVVGDAGDYVGAEMTGGTIEVTGSAGDWVGAALEGAKYGMNRGEILIGGNAGCALGRRMRRGLIVVCGDVGELSAWKMLAGTIIVFGASAAKTGTDIQRGTVILAGGGGSMAGETNAERGSNASFLGSAFSAGGTGKPQIVQFLATWLKQNSSETLAAQVELKLLEQSFVQYNGVELNQNRAEIFVAD